MRRQEGFILRRDRSTRALLTLLVGVIAVPLLTLSGILLARFATAERDRLAQDGRDTVGAIAAALDRELLALEATLNAAARAPVLRGESRTAIHDYLVAVARPLGANMTLRDGESRQVVNTSVPIGGELPAATSLRASDREARATGRPVVSDVFTGIVSGQSSFGLVTAVPESGGQAGPFLLSLSMPLGRIDEIVASIALPEAAALAILDRAGTVVARAGAIAVPPGRPAPALAALAAADDGAPLAADAAPFGEGVRLFRGASAHAGWRVVLAIPVRALDAPLLWSLGLLAAVGALLTALALLLAAVIGQRFARPIARLAQQAAQLGSGQILPPIATSVREIRLVGDALAAASIVLREEAARRDAAEAALRELNATLEAQVAARTAALTRTADQLRVEMERRAASEGQLRQMQKIEAIGQLTGGIAHDFNNMLAVIIGSLRLLRRRMERGEGGLERLIDGAVDGAERAAALTQRLLAFSRQQSLAPETIDANRMTSDISTLLRRTIPETIRIETVLAGGLWRLHADPSQLENCLLNLALNARDAMPDGGRLTIETANAHLDESYAAGRPDVVPGQYVMIAVTDSGHGMSAEVMSRAFDPFFTTKPAGQGTGLGLSQVYGFIKQSGGHVALYSEPGHGTTVKLYLPRHAGAAAAAEIVLPAAPPLPDGAGITVLVVEDDASVRDVTVEMLRDLGYRVIAADGGAAALRALERAPEVALMLTDVVMPDMNGRKLAEAALRRHPALKVLFTTGYTRNAIVHNGVLDPDVQLIAKPFTVEALSAKIRDVLRGAPAPGDGTPAGAGAADPEAPTAALKSQPPLGEKRAR